MSNNVHQLDRCIYTVETREADQCKPLLELLKELLRISEAGSAMIRKVSRE